MNIGMLWFDNDTKSDLETKIQRASSYYQTKYGKQPNLCFVHPSMTPEGHEDEAEGEKTNKVLRAGSVEVRTTRTVLPNHLWLGINGTNGHAKS
jgi:hypothetical protein